MRQPLWVSAFTYGLRFGAGNLALYQRDQRAFWALARTKINGASGVEHPEVYAIFRGSMLKGAALAVLRAGLKTSAHPERARRERAEVLAAAAKRRLAAA